MKLHPNAKLTVSGRLLLVQRVRDEGQTVRQAAEAGGVSLRTAYKWLSRYRAEGRSGLVDRSSRPRRCPHATPPQLVRRIERLRRRRRTAWEIAEDLELAPSTVSRIVRRLGLGRLWRVDQAEAPPQRYEHPRPGSLVHVDAKKLAKIQGIGHRIHGNRQRRRRGGGWEVVFVAIDDHSRFAYAEVLPKEDARGATAFWNRALRRFEQLGISVERVLTDNAKAYASHAFADLNRQRGVRHLTTRPYTPRTNGKAERFIQTLLREWAYARPYRTSRQRTKALRAFLAHYNRRRPHGSLGARPPISRLRARCEQRVRTSYPGRVELEAWRLRAAPLTDDKVLARLGFISAPSVESVQCCLFPVEFP